MLNKLMCLMKCKIGNFGLFLFHSVYVGIHCIYKNCITLVFYMFCASSNCAGIGEEEEVASLP